MKVWLARSLGVWLIGLTSRITMFIFDILVSFFLDLALKFWLNFLLTGDHISPFWQQEVLKRLPSPLDRLISTNFFIILGSRIQRFERMTWIYIGCRDAVWLVQKPAVFPGYDLPFNTKSWTLKALLAVMPSFYFNCLATSHVYLIP